MGHKHGVSPLTVIALVTALVAISSSGPLIAYAAAPALALAFYRNALAVGVLAPAAVLRRRTEIPPLWRDREIRWSLWAGVFLAAHFATWMSAARLTTVAVATALACSQPAWAGLIARLRGERLSGATWAGIGLATAGAAIATGVDLHAANGRAIVGDLLALAGGLFAAIYTTFGERARERASTTSYTAICYAVCAAVLGIACLLGEVPLTGFPATTWLAILGLTAGAQLLGHSMFSYALHEVSATMIGVLVLLEVPGSAFVAWLWLGQAPPAAVWPGIALLIGGVGVVILGGRRRVSEAATADAAASL